MTGRGSNHEESHDRLGLSMVIMTSGGLSGNKMHRIQVGRIDRVMITIGRGQLRIISGGTCKVIGAEHANRRAIMIVSVLIS